MPSCVRPSCGCLVFLRWRRRRRLPSSRRAGFAPPHPPSPGHARDLQRPLRHLHRQVRGPLDDAERAAHRRRTHALHRRPLVGVARRHEEPLDVAAEAFLLLRVGDRRAQHLRDVARDRLARELQRRERLVDALAANQLQHEPRLLGRRANDFGGCLCFDHGCTPRFAFAGRARPPARPPPPSRSSWCAP